MALRRLLPKLLAALLLVVAAPFVWLACQVLESPAGPLDRLIPEDARLIVRLDPGSIRASKLARVLWEHEIGVELRERLDVEGRVLGPVREAEQRLSSATFGLIGDELERDVAGEEVVIADVDGDVLVLSRLSGRARAFDALRAVGESGLRQAGVRLEGDIAVLDRDDVPPLFLARHRDTLIVTTSRSLLDDVRARAVSDLERTPFSASLGTDSPPGESVRFFARPSALVDGDVDDESADLLGFWRSVFPPDGVDQVGGEIDLSGPIAVRIRVDGRYGEPPPAVVADLPRSTSRGAADFLSVARSLALPEEGAVACGIGVSARDAVRVLVESQPPSRRDLLEQLLAEDDLTVGGVIETISSHLQDGCGGVVARLRDVDALPLDDPERGGLVEPLPATLVVFRLRSADGADALLRDIARSANGLFGSALDIRPEELPGGARLYRLERPPTDASLRLLHPGFAVDGRWFVFCTNEAYLERAVRARQAATPDDAVASGDVVAVAELRATALHALLMDGRWEWAERRTFHDWKAERAELVDEVRKRYPGMRDDEMAVYLDSRIEERARLRLQDEFPAALAEYRRRMRRVGLLGDSRIELRRRDREFGVEIEAAIRR